MSGMASWRVRTLLGVFFVAAHCSIFGAEAFLSPSQDRIWLAHDYYLLAWEAQAHDAPLPTTSSPETKEIFERLISTNNFRPLLDSTQPSGQRVGEYVRLQKSVNFLFLEYLRIGNDGTLRREIGELCAFSINLAGVGTSVTREYIQTLSNNETKQRQFEESGSQVMVNLLNNSVGLAKRLGSDYGRPILGAIGANISIFKPIIPANGAVELKKVLISLKHDEFKESASIEIIIKALED